MPVTKERIARLRELGLSEYGARAYLALLDLGTSDARAVASLSRVPASKVYHALEHLHEKGLVHVLAESPKRYAPIPIESFLDAQRDEHAKRAALIREERASIASLLAPAEGALAGEHANARGGAAAGVTLLRGAQVRERLVDMLARAERQCLVIVGSGSRDASTALGVEDALDEAATRLDVQVIETPSATRGVLVLPDVGGALLAHAGHADGEPTALHADGEAPVALLRALAERAMRAPSSWGGEAVETAA